MSKVILITGGAGYIGSHTVKLLFNKGYKVIVLDIKHRHALMPIGVDYIQGDMGDRSLLDKIFATYSIDVVINLAAFTSVDKSVANPIEYYTNNVFKTGVLLDAMIANGIMRHVFSSSAAVYGDPKSSVVNESHSCEPLTPYGSTKRMIEIILNDYDQAYGLKSVVFRYFNVSGFGNVDFLCKDDLPNNLIPLCMSAACVENGTFNIFGSDYPTIDGTCERDFVNVEDIARAHDLAINHLELENSSAIINLGSGVKYSVNHVVASIKAITESKLNINYMLPRKGDIVSVCCDIQAANRILGWVPLCSDLQTIITSMYNTFYKDLNNIAFFQKDN